MSPIWSENISPVLMVTDPPYGVEYQPEWRNTAFGEANRSTGTVSNDDRADWRDAWKLYNGPVVYVWHAGTKSVIVAESIEASGFEIRSQIIWGKPHFVISRVYDPFVGSGQMVRTALWTICSPAFRS